MTSVISRPTAAGHERMVLLLACLGSFTVIMDATIAGVALPQIRSALGFSTHTVAWTVNAYTLTFAGFLLLGGRCGDVFGVRRTFLCGMGVFTVARVVAGTATSPELLLGARAVQGLGGALLAPITLALLTTTFAEPARRARAVGTWSAVGAVAAASGPVVGGLLTQILSWRWVFFIGLPLGLAAMVLAARVLSPGQRTGGRLDVPGGVLATTSLLTLVYGIMKLSGPKDIWLFVPLVIGCLLMSAFLVHQARWAANPLLPLTTFRRRAVTSGNAVMLLLGFGFFSSPILLALYMRDVMGYGPLRAGLGYLPVGIAMFIGAQAAGPFTVRWGTRRAATVCCITGAAGFAAVAAMLGPSTPYLVAICLPGLVLGLGSAAAFTPVTIAATHGVPAAEQGLAAGLLNTTRQTSAAAGLAALSTISASVTASAGGANSDAALANGYSAAFFTAACCLLAAAVLARLCIPRDKSH